MMARVRNFIGTTETGKLSALGNQKQRDYDYIAGILNDPEISKYFAEPSVREDNQSIDWYTEAKGKIKDFEELNATEVSKLKRELTQLFNSLEQKRLASTTEFDQETIRNLTMLPDEASIKKVGDQYVIINWAYKLHKKEKNATNPENFAGLVDTSMDDTSQPAEEELNPNPPSSQPTSENTTQDNSPNATEPDIVDEDIPVDEPIQKEEIENEPNQDTFAKSLFQKKWLWVAIFLFLLLLNVLMLKDACGVRSIPFLYFC